MRVLGLALCVLFAGTAYADVVHFVDGRTVEGESTWTDDGLQIRLAQGSILVPKKDVARVEVGPVQKALADDAPNQRARGFIWIGGKWRTPAGVRKFRAARKLVELRRASHLAEQALKRSQRRLKRAQAIQRAALQRLEEACLQEAYSSRERMSRRSLLARDARVRRTKADLRIVEAALRAFEECGTCAWGCGVPSENCPCQRRLQAINDRVATLERRLASRRDARAAAVDSLRETVEPTRIAGPAAELRLAERRTALARQAARHAKPAARKAKALLVAN